jgi:hypothetical protein
MAKNSEDLTVLTDVEFDELKKRLGPGNETIHRVDISDEEITSLSREQAEDLMAHFGSHVLITLPSREREFFEWVRQFDPEIWDDLWGGDEEPYLVSIGFLADLLPNKRGFLICDLVEHENYDFSAANISEEGKMFFDASLEIVRNNGKLTLAQAFIVEVWRAPIDQWRFAYMYNIALESVKELVQWMLSEELLLRTMSKEEEMDMSDSEL